MLSEIYGYQRTNATSLGSQRATARYGTKHYAVSDFGGLGAREMEHVASLGERPYGCHRGLG
eukprot:SAG31_NODE_758_length_12292_cov_14.175511_3_plen_62_part_00